MNELRNSGVVAERRAEPPDSMGEARYRALFEDAAIGILEVDEDDRIVAANAAFCALVGYSQDELLGKSIHDLTAPEDAERTSELNAKAHSGELRTFSYEKRYLRRDGSRVWVHVTVSVVRDDARGFVRGVAGITDITQRKRAEEALRESEAKFRSVFEQAAVGIGRVRFSDARWIDVNEAFCAMLGRAREDMLATPWPEITHPDDLDLDLVPFRRMAAGELDSYSVEKRFIHGDGHHVWAKLTLSVVRDASGRPDYEIAVIEDITERKRAQAELLDANMRLRLHVESTPLAVVEWDADYRVVGYSGRAQEMFGWSADEVLGKRIDEIPWVPEEDWPSVRAVMRDMNTGARPTNVHANRNVRKDGSFIECEWYNSTLYDATGRVRSVLSFVLDVTDRKRAEEALREADRRKDEFLGMLSHELRNPLAPIRNSVYLLRRPDATPEQAARARAIIERQAEHLTRLVDDLLDVTRIARGKILLNRDRIDVREIVQRAVEDARAVIENRGVKLRAFGPTAKLWADADATRITQIIGNLLANARKFTLQGDEITVTVREVDATAEISVRDTGAGIDPELLPNLFDAFVQGTRTLARSEGGLGLGLALVRGLTELHGGSVRAFSEGQGRGAEFIVRLPLVGSLVVEPPRQTAPHCTVPRRRVLIVDDNADAAESLAEIVGLFGHEVEVAYDGPSAIEKVRQRRPDIVLCDIGLPGMDGYELAQRLRAEQDGSVRLIAVSGYAQDEDVKKSVEAGFDAHVAKPPDMDQIERLLS